MWFQTLEVLNPEFVKLCLVFFRLRALSDLEGQLQMQQSELQSLCDLEEDQEGGENPLQELEMQWEETQRAFSDG